jgi:acetyltransferase
MEQRRGRAVSARRAELPRPAIRPYPSQYAGEFRMTDGTTVTVRPISPEDEPLMVQFHGKL